VTDPACAHQVDPKLQLSVLGREEQPLATPRRPCKAAPFQRGERRVERLQRGDVRGAGSEHWRCRDERIELADPRLDLR
jgi:hypothetical protein